MHCNFACFFVCTQDKITDEDGNSPIDVGRSLVLGVGMLLDTRDNTPKYMVWEVSNHVACKLKEVYVLNHHWKTLLQNSALQPRGPMAKDLLCQGVIVDVAATNPERSLLCCGDEEKEGQPERARGGQCEQGSPKAPNPNSTP